MMRSPERPFRWELLEDDEHRGFTLRTPPLYWPGFPSWLRAMARACTLVVMAAATVRVASHFFRRALGR